MAKLIPSSQQLSARWNLINWKLIPGSRCRFGEAENLKTLKNAAEEAICGEKGRRKDNDVDVVVVVVVVVVASVVVVVVVVSVVVVVVVVSVVAVAAPSFIASLAQFC